MILFSFASKSCLLNNLGIYTHKAFALQSKQSEHLWLDSKEFLHPHWVLRFSRLESGFLANDDRFYNTEQQGAF